MVSGMNEVLKQARKFVLMHDEKQLLNLMQRTKHQVISLEEWSAFVYSFTIEMRQSICNCINICGSGASGIAKPNISSVASIYLAAISGIDIVKSGSRAHTGIFGSSDFFEAIGILGYTNPFDILNKYHWGYFDHWELSPWKQYKDVFRINTSLAMLFASSFFFDYAPRIQFLGISNPTLLQQIQNCICFNLPPQIHTVYTVTSLGYLDEAADGEVFYDGVQIMHSCGNKCVAEKNAQEILKRDLELLYGECPNDFWRISLLRTLALILQQIGFTATLKDGMRVARQAYQDKSAARFIESIKHDLRF